MIDGKKVTGILVAAGRSTRMGFDKLFYRIRGREILLLSFEKMASHPLVDEMVVVAGDNIKQVECLLADACAAKNCKVVRGGDSRTESVAAGLAACEGTGFIAIHDAARPFVSEQLISRVIEAAGKMGAAAPSTPMRDTVKRVREGFVMTTLPRSDLAAVQTPQVFEREAFEKALSQIPKDDYPFLTDDCMVMERAGKPVMLVEGELANRKITTQEDLRQGAEPKALRIGHGYDVHKLVTGRELILGGVTIPCPKGLLGYSDADVLSHAVMDAMFGAAALGDLGTHFPDTDATFKDASSIRLLGECAALVRQAGYVLQNLDATVLCEAPKLAPRIPAMQRNIARVLGADTGCVSVKATTEEGLGFTGHGDGIAAHCVALLREF